MLMKLTALSIACLYLATSWAIAGFIINPYRHIVAGGVSTSYANTGGSGDRSGSITITESDSLILISEGQLIDGVTGSGTAFFNGYPAYINDGSWFAFDFGASRLVDEAKFYQQNTTSHGTWKIQGSDDAAAWSDIGSSFTLGGAAEQTITAINGNTTAYRHLRFYLITGPSSNVPYLYEIEFKISAP